MSSENVSKPGLSAPDSPTVRQRAGRPPVPVKPAAASAANAVTLAGAAMAANPVLGAVAVAAVVGGAGLIAGGRAVRNGRRARIATPALSSRRLRRALSASAFGRGAAAGNGQGPLRRALGELARTPPTPRRRPAVPRSGASTGSGASGLRLPRIGPTTRGRSKPAAATSARSPMARTARRAGLLGAALTGAGTGLVWRAARAGGRGVRRGWRALGRAVRRDLLGIAPVERPPVKRHVSAAVKRPAATSTTPAATKRTTLMPDQTSKLPQPPAPVGPVYTAARQVHKVAVDAQIRGVMELRTEAYEFPHTIQALADAITARAMLCTKEAVDPAYASHLAQIATTVQAAAQAARNLGAAFDALHEAEIRRILRPRPNEQKWDTSANRPRG